MSATTHSSHRDVNQPDTPHTQSTRDQSMDHALIDDRLCPGCKKSAVTEHGGLVVAFGCVHDPIFATRPPIRPPVVVADRPRHIF